MQAVTKDAGGSGVINARASIKRTSRMARSRKNPVKKRKVATPEPVKLGYPCPCGEPAGERFAVMCAACERWWHGDCIGFPPKYGPFISTLYCTRCTKEYKLKTRWHPHCRLPGCEVPATQPGSAYCSPEHAQKYWKGRVCDFKDPDIGPEVLQWLVDRSQSVDTFETVAPDNIPRAPKDLTSEQKDWKQRYDKAVQFKEECGKCGFDPPLLGLEGAVCEGPAPFCDLHGDWPTTALKRWELSTEDEDLAALPDREWLAKRAKFLVAGTTRFSKRRRLRAAYFLPYVWEPENDSYFLEDDPEPFWNKHF